MRQGNGICELTSLDRVLGVNDEGRPMLCKGVTVDVDGVTGFDELYEEVGPRLWRSILAFTGGRRDLTDDVVAEAFLRTLESGNNVRDRRHTVSGCVQARRAGTGAGLGLLADPGGRHPGRSRAHRVVRRASFAIAERAGRRVPALPGRSPDRGDLGHPREFGRGGPGPSVPRATQARGPAGRYQR